MVVAAPDLDLLVVGVDGVAEHAGRAEVERRVGHGPDLARGDAVGAQRQETVRLSDHDLPEDRARVMAGEVHVGVVGHAHVGGGVRLAAVGHGEHVGGAVRGKREGRGERAVSGEAELAVGEAAAHAHRVGGVVCHGVPEALVQPALGVGVVVVGEVGPVVVREVVDGAVERDLGAIGAVCHGAHGAAVEGGVGAEVPREVAKAQDHVGERARAVRHVDAQDRGAVVAHAHARDAVGQLEDVRLLAVGQGSERGRLDHDAPLASVRGHAS